MPATIKDAFRSIDGNRHKWYVDLNLGVYATGGVTVTPSQLNLRTVVFVECEPAGGYQFVYDRPTQKFLAYSSGGTQVTNATDLTAQQFRCAAVGHE